MQRVLASIVGALIVLGFHVAIVRATRSATSQAYYRHRPAQANIAVLIRECGLVALTQGFVALRIAKLLLTTIVYVGRVDTPFLYTTAGQIGGFRIDSAPYMFQIDILQHEAHRHPYIEMLGAMYLSKLRHGNDFCNPAGSCWRLIFVYVLMPWLSKYRAVRRSPPPPELTDEEAQDGENGVPRPAAPLRARTLFDPQAYALRAVSLAPVTGAGRTGGSAMSLMGPRAVSSNLSLIRDDEHDDAAEEKIEELEGEIFRLKAQLRMQALDSPSAGAHVTPERKERKARKRFDATVPKPGWEGDYEDIVESVSPNLPKPHGVDQDDMVPRRRGPPSRTEYLGDDSPPAIKSAMRRKKSAGLQQASLPPKGGHGVSWGEA